VCGWQVKLCDPLVIHWLISERFRDEELVIKCYINSSVNLLLLYYRDCNFVSSVHYRHLGLLMR